MSQSQPTEPTDIKEENGRLNQDTTSQYQIRPSIGKSFPIAAIREIINEVLLQNLDGELSNL